MHLQSVHVLSRVVSISADAIEACCEQGIPILSDGRTLHTITFVTGMCSKKDGLPLLRAARRMMQLRCRPGLSSSA